MKKITVEFEARCQATLEVPDDATEEDIQDAVADIDIPENDECKYIADTFEPKLDTLAVRDEELTVEQCDAVAKAMGYLPDEEIIINAIEEHEDEDAEALRAALQEKVAVFQAQGGRGVELADEIDRLRIAQAVREA